MYVREHISYGWIWYSQDEQSVHIFGTTMTYHGTSMETLTILHVIPVSYGTFVACFFPSLLVQCFGLGWTRHRKIPVI